MKKENIKNEELKALVSKLEVYGSLFINSVSEVKQQADWKNGMSGLPYYTVYYKSLEDMSISAARNATQTRSGESDHGNWHKELSPETVKAIQNGMINNGELKEIKGYSIAVLEYNKPYILGGKLIVTDKFVFTDAADFEKQLTQRLQSNGLIKREVTQPEVIPS